MPTERPVSRPLSVNLDFKRANLSGANFYGAKLDSADLSGANLSGAKLDLAWIMRANFTGANLSNASLFGPVVSSGLDTSPAEAPIFRRANFSGARVIARLIRFDLRGANFTGAKMGADMTNQSMGLIRTDLACRFQPAVAIAPDPCVEGHSRTAGAA
jgi:uncharacterized protein YjbI with pentapeptide repeats